MIRYIVGPKAFGEREVSQDDHVSIDNEIWEIIFVKLEENLTDKGRDFFCSDDKITIVDIQYYNDIMQILTITSAFEDFKDAKYSKLNEWFMRVSKAFADKKKASNHEGKSIL